MRICSAHLHEQVHRSSSAVPVHLGDWPAHPLQQTEFQKNIGANRTGRPSPEPTTPPGADHAPPRPPPPPAASGQEASSKQIAEEKGLTWFYINYVNVLLFRSGAVLVLR